MSYTNLPKSLWDNFDFFPDIIPLSETKVMRKELSKAIRRYKTKQVYTNPSNTKEDYLELFPHVEVSHYLFEEALKKGIVVDRPDVGIHTGKCFWVSVLLDDLSMSDVVKVLFVSSKDCKSVGIFKPGKL
jgi:hypothetical protein